MSILPKSKTETAEKPGIRSEAPAVHVDALLRILEETDRALAPLTARGMDGRTATILKEIEKSGAIEIRIDGDDLWIDVIDRKRALSVIDQLIAQFRR